ncbi:MAG: glycosyltransferase family 2 protein [Ignavibacteriae bacterium]|nr:glycosyltransferase family 2 protein [Ignavibacteriota bacterium]
MGKEYRNTLSIIIVTWNSEEDIAECLGSIYNSFHDESILKVQTVVVDNYSSDNSASVVENFMKVFPHDIKLIKNNVNYGFTKGCNIGISEATGDFIMLLNPDTQIQNDALQKLVEYLKSRDDVGAIAPLLYSRNKTIQYSCRTFPGYIDLFFEISALSTLFPSSRFFSRWKMKYFGHNELREVEQPMAAALMIKADVLKAMNYLDERFYMFFNDIDTCKQIYNLGYKIVFFPEATVYHKIGTSILKDRVRMIKAWNEDCLRYFRKNEYSPFLHAVLFLGLKITGTLRIIFTKLLYK